MRLQASRSLALGTEPPKRRELHKKSRQYPLSLDEIHCRRCGATVYEISRLGRFMKYYWLPFSAYTALPCLYEAIEQILTRVGTE